MNQSKSLGDGKLPKRRATAEDVAIGQKVRALRFDRGLSQSELASQVGVTFQQVQKYENGANRISAGRLALIARALGMPVTAFYGLSARPERERGFSYLRSAGAVRLGGRLGGALASPCRRAL